MFLVRDNLKTRKALIEKSYSSSEISGVYLAQVNFEWIVQRVILIMDRKWGKRLFGKNLNKYKTLNQFLRIWDQQISNLGNNAKSEPLLPLDKVITEWGQLKKISFSHHPIAKSSTGKLLPAYTEERLAVLLNASEDVHKYALTMGIDVFKRLPNSKKR